jgi:16S rRNA (guanine1207-N2)-methyltransferase
MEILVYRSRTFALQRFPLKEGDRLRAWDTADQYLLRAVEPEVETAVRLVLVNDAFGALGVPLCGQQPVTWGDSVTAERALHHNLAQHGLAGPAPLCVGADQTPVGPFDLALVKLPRNLAFFEDQLLRLRTVLAPGARVLTGAMIKHTPPRAYRLLEEIIGPTRTSQGWKKARLADSSLTERPGLPATLALTTYTLPGTDLVLQNLPNVFSREKPDLGTRLLLQHLPALPDELSAVDLGCGNGILAVALARCCPQASILGVDESYQAVASARLNAAVLGADGRRLTFRVADSLAAEPESSHDLVVCNPPFHQGQTTGDLTAWHLFREAHRVLRPGGELRIVGNRHLDYHAKLRRLFAQVTVVGSDRRFVVLKAGKACGPA